MQEKKGGKEEREGEVQGKTMDLAAFEYARAAGSWQQDFEMCSLTNPLLWQMPDVSHHFPTFQFMVCWHTQESYLSIEGNPGCGEAMNKGLPLVQDHQSPTFPAASGSFAGGRAAEAAT